MRVDASATHEGVVMTTVGNNPASLGRAHDDGRARPRKPWRTPVVIRETVSEETGTFLNPVTDGTGVQPSHS